MSGAGLRGRPRGAWRAVGVLLAAVLAVGGCGSANQRRSGVSTDSASATGSHAAPLATVSARASAAATAPTRAAAATTTAASTTAASTTAAGAAASPATAATPCTKHIADRFVYVSIRAQHLWLCADAKTVYDSAVTTGAVDLPYDSTPTGTYRIQARDRNSVLTLNTGAQYTVKYWIPFDGPLFGFHDASWQKMPYGSPKYRTRGSHGCIHMSLAAIRHLYAWAEVGTTVRIKG